MTKIKATAPKTVAKKDNTNVARKRVSSELVGDKPTYSHMGQARFESGGRKMTKADSSAYGAGFRETIGKYKKQGKPNMSTDVGSTFKTPAYNAGSFEAWSRSMWGPLNKKATVRDSSIPLAPTQFPD